jgi:hypothetical protein
MARLKGLDTGLLAQERGESSDGRVPPNRAASGARKAGEARPDGARVPSMTSTAGDLPAGSVFAKTDPTKRS